MKFIFTITLLSVRISMHAAVMRSRDAILMGGRFDITIVAADSATAEHYIDSVIMEAARIEALVSDWKPSSQMSEINRRAGIAGVKIAVRIAAKKRIFPKIRLVLENDSREYVHRTTSGSCAALPETICRVALMYPGSSTDCCCRTGICREIVPPAQQLLSISGTSEGGSAKFRLW